MKDIFSRIVSLATVQVSVLCTADSVQYQAKSQQDYLQIFFQKKSQAVTSAGENTE
jgi:hypothetical protein